MRDDIWYREELVALMSITEDAIRRLDPANVLHMTALGGLHRKLERAIETAPSARTREASS